jgi:hypothetical protein
MNQKEIPDSAIEVVAKHINDRNNSQTNIPISGPDENTETPHYFEIIPFDKIDDSSRKFFAIDGSYNAQEFYNGLSVALYTAGYVCYHNGKQIRLNDKDDPIILGKNYFPNNILITNQDHAYAIFDEFLSLEPVKNFIQFSGVPNPYSIFSYSEKTIKEEICSNTSKLLSFCQEVLEWTLVYEIAELPMVNAGDFILRDGILRSNNVKQVHLVKLGKYLKEKGLISVAVTKNSALKLELSSAFKKIDNYLETTKKPTYPFTIKDPKRQKLCCWFEVPDDILDIAYKGNMFTKKDITGGRGFGLFFVARLDYVEKLQNYDWVVVDLNIFDVIPNIEEKSNKRDLEKIKQIFFDLTRLTQEHYILGYPYPLVEVHNFVTLKNNFKEGIINRVKFALYKEQRMDNVDIENLFLDIHGEF